jgi:nucleotide-binding universal stress UspA family protein
MFKQVIVGVDQHQGGRDAIALAKLLVASDGELTLAHVYLGDPTLTRPSGSTFGAGERKRGRELLTAVRDESGVDAKLLCTASSSVGRGLHEVVEAQGADLLAVGSCQRSFVGRVLVGDDTRDALNGAPCAIAVAPFGYSQHSAVTSEIGVGYNGSPESVHALAVARQLAAEQGARVSAFEVVLLSDYPFGPDSGPVDTAISAFVDQARARIAALGDIEPHAGYGWSRRGTGAVRRLGRPAHCGLPRLRPDRPARSRQHLPAAHAHRAMSAARAVPRGTTTRSGQRKCRHGRGRGRLAASAHVNLALLRRLAKR